MLSLPVFVLQAIVLLIGLASVDFNDGDCGQLAYFDVSANLITYLTGPLGHSNAVAASAVNAWPGTACLMPVLGAFVADSWLGCYSSIILACTLYVLVR
ncbi:Peptide transporter PTR1 [Hordeum vulgare]|nr:Peptide transporter PTR1 [Hordeum vulgare]